MTLHEFLLDADSAAVRAVSSVVEPPAAVRAGWLGVGVDVVDIADFERSLKVGRERWLAKVFTEHELLYAQRHPDRLASRFAAKEAVVKALGIGFRDGVSPRAVEIVCNDDGEPHVKLHGGAAAASAAAGVGSVLISMSRDGGLAVAAAWALA